MTDDASLFDRPPGDWTDAELHAGLAVLTTERDVAAASGEDGRAARLNAMACVLAEQRDARRRVLADAAAASNPFTQVMPGRILASKQQRKRGRRPHDHG